jgi:DNA-binding transcriptional regulator GbsR (MarR family)
MDTKQLDEQTIKIISELGKEFSDSTILMHEAIAKKAGISITDHKYLSILIQHGAITAGELAKLTGLTTGAITGLVDRLEKRNLVKRRFDKDDRRKVLIVPHYGSTLKTLSTISVNLKNRVVEEVNKLSHHEMEIIQKYLLSTIQIMNDFKQDLQENQ